MAMDSELFVAANRYAEHNGIAIDPKAKLGF